jgi:hypothetical protein
MQPDLAIQRVFNVDRAIAKEIDDRFYPLERHSMSDSCDGQRREAKAATKPSITPATPPKTDKPMASNRNCKRMSRRRAPTAIRMPISLVRSVTDTSMMLRMPIPPVTSETSATDASRTDNVLAAASFASATDDRFRRRYPPRRKGDPDRGHRFRRMCGHGSAARGVPAEMQEGVSAPAGIAAAGCARTRRPRWESWTGRCRFRPQQALHGTTGAAPISAHARGP